MHTARCGEPTIEPAREFLPCRSMEQWATAKINLFLRVLDRRADGYHNIETVYQSVGLADRLTIQAAADEIVVDCRGGDAPSGRENIAYRAVELMQRCFPGRVGAVHIEIEKRIPIGSGLGGGSADAATVLRACNTLFSLGLSAERLRLPGSQLGMDVPFLIKGGRAIGRERGDQLSPLAVGESGWAVIAVPHLSISTRWAYEQLAVRQSCGAPSVEDFVDHLETKPLK
ncbi:4-(cytidine 5'-diphospho)-2-C-methyl-D-erythritol kinase, partial [Candidatus Sumerlaeota bacterium]|nr:4-(cytidine 5'-diphospho)-2-C-methyl-D-erythritol kinase [Candidatus Sumerlaeota bacterium]